MKDIDTWSYYKLYKYALNNNIQIKKIYNRSNYINVVKNHVQKILSHKHTQLQYLSQDLNELKNSNFN